MPRRSRGCQVCKDRRIRCDGGAPCSQCRRARRECPGPLEGAIIINQTQSVAARHRRSETALSTPSSSGAGITIVDQPSPRAIVSLAFVAHFISFITSTQQGHVKQSWLYSIDSVPLAQKGPALDLALEAVAAAYCGVSSNNRSAAVEASKLYGDALSRYSIAVAQCTGIMAVTWKICTSVMLSLFEAIWPTNPAAYAMHLKACAKMLASAASELNGNELFNSVARHVRHQMLFVLATTPPEGGDLASDPEIRALAQRFANMEPDRPSRPFDRLVTELYILLMSSSLKTPQDEEAVALRDVVEGRIDKLWAEFQLDSVSPKDDDDVEAEFSFDRRYRDAFTSVPMAYFAAARILLLARKQEAEASSGAIEDHAQTILTCSSLLLNCGIGCAFMRMLFPLTIAGMHSPSSQQRAMACMFLEKWLCGPTFSGLSSMALERIASVHATHNTDSLGPPIAYEILAEG